MQLYLMIPIKYNIKYRVIYFIFFIKIIGGFYSMGNKQIIVRFGNENKNVVAKRTCKNYFVLKNLRFLNKSSLPS